MKRLLTFFFLFCISLGAKATHIAGGDIQYRYVGDSTGVANHYEVLLRVYRDCSPTSSSFISGNITITSSCFATQTVALSKINGPLPNGEFYLPTYLDCVNAGSVTCLAMQVFKGMVTLPGLCSDYKFSYSDCCRPTGINNLVNSSAQSFYFDATLNNFLGANSSASFTKESARAFCVGQNAIWNQYVSDADGDSIVYTLTSAKGSGAMPLAYAAGYTSIQPISTNPVNTFSLDAATGTMNFVPSAIGNYVIAFKVSEYRIDTIYNTWVLIGSSSRELFASVTAYCSPSIGVLIDYNAPGTYVDPQTGLPTIDFVCNDSIITLKFFKNISCYSIASNASDFRLTDSAGQPLPLKSASTICNSFDESDSIRLHMLLPFSANGSYILYSKTGDDGNTILNGCGFSMAEFDTIQLKVSNCSGVGIQEQTAFDGIILPNMYSPNGDGINDRFIIQIPDDMFGEYNLTIVNGLGQTILQTQFLGSSNWEALNPSNAIPVGMYYSILSYTNPQNGEHKSWSSALSIFH